MKKAVKLVIASVAAVIALAAAGHYGWQYYTVGRFEESTDDAYLKADITAIAPKVAGYITQVLVADNEPVAKGQVLVRIDDQDYKAHVAAAEADVAAAQADLTNLDARIRLQHSAIDQSQAESSASDADATSPRKICRATTRWSRTAPRPGSGSTRQRPPSARPAPASQRQRPRSRVPATR